MKFRSFVSLVFVLGLTTFSHAINAQDFTSIRRVADLNPGSVGSFPSNFTTLNGILYFSAYTFDTGRELWKYDGTNITLVTNINDTVHDVGGGVFAGNDSAPGWLTLFNGALYFSAYDQRRGGELWRYDGTRAVRVADINPDPNDNVKPMPNSSWPQEFTVVNNILYFSADSGGPFTPNYELWQYDGAQATLVTNIHADFGTNHSSYPNHMKAFNGALYFMADDGVNGYELWKHDASGTVLLANINPGGPASSSFPKWFTPYKGELYFQAFDDVNGYELWKTDGTTVSLVTNLNPAGSSFPESFIVFQDALFFPANDGTSGFELWKYDGTTATLVADLNPFGDSAPKNLTIFQNNLYFSANDGVHGFELWKYDGTNVSLVADLNPVGDSFPEQLIVWNNRLYFSATNEASGYELWQFDGQTARTAADIYPGPPSSFPFNPAGFGAQLCVSANDGPFTDWELWSIGTIPFRITSIEQSPQGMRLTWRTAGGTTNIVQAADSLTGQFQDLSEPLYISGSGETITNYVDLLTPGSPAARFYRIISR